MHWTKKTFYILITVLLLAASLYLYIDNIFLPYQFKQFVTLKIQEALKRPVHIREIHFTALRGIVIQDLTVYQGQYSTWPFLRVEEASFPLILTPGFQYKTLVIPAVHLKRPYAHLIREGKDTWNFSDLLPSSKSSAAPLRILVRKITVEDGEIVLADQTRQDNARELISGIDIDLRLSLNQVARFKAEALLPRREGRLQIKGNYRIGAKELSSSVTLKNIPLAPYLALCPLPADLIFREGVLRGANLTINFQNEKLQAHGNFLIEEAVAGMASYEIAAHLRAVEASLSYGKEGLTLKGRFNLPSLRLTAPGEKTFGGKMDAEIKSLEAFQGKISLQGEGNLRQGRLALGKDMAGRAETIDLKNTVLESQNGRLRLQTSLDTKDLSAETAAGKFSLRDLSSNRTILTVENGQLHCATDLALSEGRFLWDEERYFKGDFLSPQMELTRVDSTLQIKGGAAFSKAVLQWTPRLKIEDTPDGEFFYEYDSQKKDTPHHYGGRLHLSQALIQGLPYLDTVENIRGEIHVETGRAHSKGLSLKTQGADIEVSGSLNDFADPALDIRASSPNINLERLFHILPVLAEKSPLIVLGNASAQASYKGKALKPQEADITLRARLNNATVAGVSFPQKVTDVNGELAYQKDLVTWTDLQGQYLQKTYTLNGQLSNFSRPVVDVKAASEDLSLSAQLKILNNAFQLSALTGKYFNTDFDVKGDVHLFEKAAPDLDLRGKFSLDLKDFPALFPAWKDSFNRLQAEGILTAEALFKGKPDDWRNWQIAAQAQSAEIRLMGYQARDIVFQHEQRDQHISKCGLRAGIYSGALELAASADLRENIPWMKVSGNLQNLDLAELRKDKLTQNQYLAGRLSALVDIEGPFGKPQELKGAGSAAIVEGHLWRFSILEGILGRLLVPEFQNIVFTDADADFTVADGRVTSDEVWLRSSTLSLKAQGWIDFEQNIHFDIAPVLGEGAETSATGPLRDLGMILLMEGENYLGLQLTGTLSSPKYKITPFPAKILEKTTDILKGGLKEGTGILKEGIKGILDEIF